MHSLREFSIDAVIKVLELLDMQNNADQEDKGSTEFESVFASRPC